MKNVIFLFLLLTSTVLFAQIETTNRVIKIEATPDAPTPETKSPTIKSAFPKINLPKVTEEQDPKFSMKNLPNPEPDTKNKLDITKGDGLLDYKTDNAPKYFSAEKKASDEYARDQNLGEINVSYTRVNVSYRDHEAVDGDQIMVLVNEDIIRARVSLYGSFQGFDLPLEKGPNKVEFIALNQGDSGPNTAELHIYDDTGKLISAKEWNLLTGYRATFVIIKD